MNDELKVRATELIEVYPQPRLGARYERQLVRPSV